MKKNEKIAIGLIVGLLVGICLIFISPISPVDTVVYTGIFGALLTGLLNK